MKTYVTLYVDLDSNTAVHFQMWFKTIVRYLGSQDGIVMYQGKLYIILSQIPQQ